MCHTTFHAFFECQHHSFRETDTSACPRIRSREPQILCPRNARTYETNWRPRPRGNCDKAQRGLPFVTYVPRVWSENCQEDADDERDMVLVGRLPEEFLLCSDGEEMDIDEDHGEEVGDGEGERVVNGVGIGED